MPRVWLYLSVEFLFHGTDYHIGVGSNVVCSTLIGNARASMRGMDNRTVHAFLCPYVKLSSVVGQVSINHLSWNLMELYQKAAMPLRALGLSPVFSPKFKTTMLPRIHKQGRPQKTLYRKHLLRVVKEVTKTFLIGMHFVLRMAGKRKHTIIW